MFLESAEEIKKDISKQASTRLAAQASLKSTLNNEKLQAERVKKIVQSNRNALMEQVITNKRAIMDVFDEMFGHNGYSGIAF